jgi:hypothetical protein
MRVEPYTVRLWRCNGCHRILGQEIVDGVPTEAKPHCGCDSPLGVSRVYVERW